MELIDGHPVVRYQVRFRDRTEINEDQAAQVKDGNIMVWLVRAECLPPSYHATTKDAEDRYRFNIQAVQEAVPLTGEEREAALVYLESGGAQGYLAFDAPRYTEAGLFDPLEHRDAERELTEIRKLLANRGELQMPGESIIECLQRLLPRPEIGLLAASAPDPEPQATDGPEHHEDHAAWERRQPTPTYGFPETNGVEVVGNIYGNGKSETRRLIEEAFGA